MRKCAQCGTSFTPRREHARFCSAHCRMAWNREHAGVAAAPAVAVDWSVTAMTEAAGRLPASAPDLPRLAAAVAETVWWVTLVDATLVRYHPRRYQEALASRGAPQETEETLEGLRYVRNQLGRSADPAGFVRHPGEAGGPAAWEWAAQPEPGHLDACAPRARQWELSRYRAYQARLAGHGITATFALCTAFLTRAASLAASE